MTALPTPGTATPPELLVGRQPILDRRMATVAYELLHRAPHGLQGAVGAEAATAQVILRGFADIGLESLVGPHRAFINTTREFLLEAGPMPFDPTRVVLELLEDQVVDGALLAVLGELRAAGFAIALDDYRHRPEYQPLLALADIVKLDVRALAPEELREHVALLRPHGLTLLAEKVETVAEFDRCAELGFDLFQGYFFTRPTIVGSRVVPTFQLQTLAELVAGGEPSFEDLERIISRDVGLSHRFLKLANSAHVGSRSRIGSVRQGLTMLGSRTVRRWALMLALTGEGDHPAQLALTGLVRARCCELAAQTGVGADPDRAFTAGLFSVLDALMGAPLAPLLDELALDDRLVAALLHGRGAEGELLGATRALERGDLGLSPGGRGTPLVVARSYRDAVGWADGVAAALA